MTGNIGLSIAIAAMVTAIIRIVPILFLARRRFPLLVRYWLNYVPAAVLSAIIAAEIAQRPQLTSFGVSVAFIAAIVSLAFGMITRSLLATVIVSILAYLLFQNL